MEIKQLTEDELGIMRDALKNLAEYHNNLDTPFAGEYPFIPIEESVEDARKEMLAGEALIEAVLDDGNVAGFCKATAHDGHGDIHYLYVYPEYRGRGYGSLMMERMLAYFRENGVQFAELRVVAGNKSRDFYEQYGFQLRSQIMAKRI